MSSITSWHSFDPTCRTCAHGVFRTYQSYSVCQSPTLHVSWRRLTDTRPASPTLRNASNISIIKTQFPFTIDDTETRHKSGCFSSISDPRQSRCQSPETGTGVERPLQYGGLIDARSRSPSFRVPSGGMFMDHEEYVEATRRPRNIPYVTDRVAISQSTNSSEEVSKTPSPNRVSGSI